MVALTCSFVCVLEGSDELWDIIVITSFISIGLSIKTGSELLLQPLVLLGTDLLEDVGHHFLNASSLRGAGNNQQILSNGERCLWLFEMNHCVVVLEHVDLIDILQLLHTKFLNG